MYRQVVLEISNSCVKAGLIETSSLPIKIFSSWGRKNDDTNKFITEVIDTDLEEVEEQQEYFRAIKANEICDLDFLIELIEYSIEKQLEIPRETFDQVQLTLVLPSQIVAVQLPLRSKIIRLIYDRLNIAGVFLGEFATMTSLGSAHGTGLVLNIDNEGIEVAAVNDFSLVTTAVDFFPKGANTFINELKNSLNSMTSDLSLPKHFSDSFNENSLKATTKLFHNSTKISLAENNPALIAFTFSNEETVSIPIEILSNVFEKVFVNTAEGGDKINLIDLIDSVVDRVDSDRRSIVLDHIIITGHQLAALPNISACIKSCLTGSVVLAASDYPAESQPTSVTFRSIPEYYHEIKECGKAYIAWFGASLAGKYAFADSKSFIPSKPHN